MFNLTAAVLVSISYTLPLDDVNGNALYGPVSSEVYCATWVNRMVKVVTVDGAEPGTRVTVQLDLHPIFYLCYAVAVNDSGRKSAPSERVKVPLQSGRITRQINRRTKP